MNIFKLCGEIVINGADAAMSTVEKVSSTTSKAGTTLESVVKKIGAAVATYLTVDTIVSFGKGCIEAAADASAASSQFSQVFGELESSAKQSLSGIADEAGISENRMLGSFTKIAAFAKTTGMDTEGALSLAERAMIAVADSAAFYDRSLEETTESLQSFLKGNFENDAALGLSCTETTRNTAANKLYGKSFKDLSEEQKQLTLLQMVEDANALSGALGQAARESDTWTNVTGNLKQSWTDFQAEIGKHVLPMFTNLISRLSGFVEAVTTKVDPAVQWLTEKFQILKTWLSDVGTYMSSQFAPAIDNLTDVFVRVRDAVQPVIDKMVEYVTGGQSAEDATNLLKDAIDFLAESARIVTDGLVSFTDWCSENQGTIEIITTIVASFATAWLLVNGAVRLWSTIGMIATAVTTAFGGAIAFLTSPITIAIAIIGALIAVGVLLYQNWDTIKEKAAELAEKVKAKWDDIKNGVKEKVDAIKTAAVEKFDALKSGVSEKIDALKSSATEKFNSIKSSITEKIEDARDKVKSAIDKIKGFFDFEWSLPALKLPHISISGSFSLKPPSAPSFGIEWYQKAMDDPLMFTKPTIFGMGADGFKGAGDAGDEVMIGKETMLNMIRQAVADESSSYLGQILALLQRFFPEILAIMERPLKWDDAVVARKLAPAMDTELGLIMMKKGRGR